MSLLCKIHMAGVGVGGHCSLYGPRMTGYLLEGKEGISLPHTVHKIT